MFTVACLWWGDKYPLEYVSKLKAGIERHLSLPHRFVCLTDRVEEPGEFFKPLNAGHLGRNMPLMAMHRPGNGLEGRVLAVDLDAVVVGSLDDIAAYDGPFAIARDFNNKQWVGGFLRSFPAGSRPDLWRNAPQSGMEIPHLNKHLGPADCWQDLVPGQVVSYKVHCKNGLPDNARIVSFHGKPDPADVEDAWVKEHWVE